MFFTRLILFILAWIIGIFLITYREKIVRMVGKNDIAEKYLGMGGTYNMWVLIGVIVIIVGLLIMMGKFSWVGL